MEIPEGFTPGPWWTAARYDGREMGCAVIAARTDAGPLPGNPTRGMVAFASAILNTDARRCEANARLIALAPNMAAELTALRADVQRLTDALAAAEAHQPTPEAVERAAEAAYEHFRGPAKKAFVPWRRLPEFGKQEWRARAIAALRSALSDPAS